MNVDVEKLKSIVQTETAEQTTGNNKHIFFFTADSDDMAIYQLLLDFFQVNPAYNSEPMETIKNKMIKWVIEQNETQNEQNSNQNEQQTNQTNKQQTNKQPNKNQSKTKKQKGKKKQQGK